MSLLHVHILSQCNYQYYASQHSLSTNDLVLSLFTLFTTGTHSLLAAILLAYLLTEPRFKPDHSRVITLLPVSAKRTVYNKYDMKLLLLNKNPYFLRRMLT